MSLYRLRTEQEFGQLSWQKQNKMRQLNMDAAFGVVPDEQSTFHATLGAMVMQACTGMTPDEIRAMPGNYAYLDEMTDICNIIADALEGKE